MGAESMIGSIVGANAQSSAAKKAAGATERAAIIAADAQKTMLNRLLELQRPYNEAGVKAVGELSAGDIDPTGGASQYMENLPEFSYAFDPNDPSYQFKLNESQKAIDAMTAARGNYNSRAAMNLISDSQQKITADETERQYDRAKDLYNIEYGKNTDLFNMATTLGTIDYNALLDLVKVGAGAAGSAGTGAIATGQGLASTYMQNAANLSNIYQQQGQTMSDLYTGIGAQPMKDYMTYLAFSGGGGFGGGGGG